MGPDGAKGDRGEPGMTVSARAWARGSIWRCWQTNSSTHTQSVDIGVVFVSVFCSVPLFLFWTQEDDVREYVRSEMSQHCGESFVQFALLIYNKVVPTLNFRWQSQAHESQPQLNSMKSMTQKKLQQCRDSLNWPLILPLFFCFLPVRLSDPQRVEVSEPFSCS